MDPFSMWLLGSVVLPEAYERVVNMLGAKSTEDRLAKRVGEDVGRYPKRVFRRWYRREGTWRALVAGGTGSFESLVADLVSCSKDRLFGRELPRRDAEHIVRAVVAAFVGSLDPADAVAVADHRSAERDARIDRNAEARTGDLKDHIDRRFDSVEEHLDVAIDFDDRLSLLPALVRPLLAAIGPTTQVVRLIEIAAADSPREALVQLTADVPPWLGEANGATLIAAAELCRCYGVHLGAGRLFELASDRSTDRAYCYARAAVELETADEPDQSRALINHATSLSTAKSVAAIAAALAERPAEVLDLLPQADALADPYLVLLRLYGLRATREYDDVIAFLGSALELYPESPGLMIELAWAHLERSQAPVTTSRTADRQRAIELGLEARRLRRVWRADAGDAARVACQAALVLGAYDRVIEIGMAQPDGEALPAEAANTEVRLSVAQAAIASGRTDLLRTVVDLVPDGFHRTIIQAEFLLNTGADRAALQTAYDAVWRSATEEEHKVLYWLSGAAAGIELQGDVELRERTDDVPLMVDAQLLAALGDHEGAVRLLRRSRRTEHTTRLIVGSLIAIDDIDGAVDELKAAATRFNDMSHLVRAVEVLGRHGRLDDASTLAQEALQKVPRALTDARAFLHEVLVEQAGVSGAWGEMAVRARAWIEDLGALTRNRWHLALALHNGGDHEGAWRILQEPPALEPSSAFEARLWIVLAAHQFPSPATAARIITLVDTYPDDKKIAEAAVGLFFGRGDEVWGDVDGETVERFQDLLNIHAVDYGADQPAAIYRITGSAEEMLQQLRPSLEANARVVSEMAEKVRQGWPYGLLAAAARRPYASTLIHRAAGCLPIAMIEPRRVDAELDAARQAIRQNVVVDVSTLVIVGHIRSAWPDLRGAFAQLHLPRPAHVDILETVEDFRRPSHGNLYFDLSIEAVRGSDSDPEVHAQLLDHGEWIAGELANMVIVDWPHLSMHSGDLDDRLLPWLSALDLAKSRGMPLWCDDVGVRTLAMNDGVSAFGTTALLEALIETSAIDRKKAHGLLRQLREAYAVDLPLDAEWVRLSAGSNEWRPGPSAFYFARPAAWVDFETAYRLWSELAQAAGDAGPIRVAGWVHASAIGLAGAVDAGRAPHVLAGIAAKGIVLANFDPEALAACTARVREVARAAGIQSPVPHLMTILLQHLSAAIGAEAATRLILSEHLADEDRAVVRDLVFAVGRRPEQSGP